MADEPTAISRRHFLAGSAALSLSAVMLGHRDQIGHLLNELGDPSPGAIRAELTSVPLPSFTFSVERESDLALLDFEFYGFNKLDSLITGATIKRIVRGTWLAPESASNVVIVKFPPQAIAEAAYNYESPQTWYVDPPPVLSAMSGRSQLCFTVPTDSTIEFKTMTAADLLDWSSWYLLVPTPAQVVGENAEHRAGGSSNGSQSKIPTPPNPIGGMATYIEYPYGLYLAPTVYSGSFIHGFTTTFEGRSEPLISPANFGDCWTAALRQTSNATTDEVVAQGAAVWADDYDAVYKTSDGARWATPEIFIDYGPA